MYIHHASTCGRAAGGVGAELTVEHLCVYIQLLTVMYQECIRSDVRGRAAGGVGVGLLWSLHVFRQTTMNGVISKSA